MLYYNQKLALKKELEMAPKSETVFELRDTIAWKDDEDFCEEDQYSLLLLKNLCGPGPFIVRNTAPVPNGEARQARHGQYIEICDISGDIILLIDDVANKFSGFWFEKIAGPKPN